jgi:Phage derived protein Gp49-like (DUF891)
MALHQHRQHAPQLPQHSATWQNTFRVLRSACPTLSLRARRASQGSPSSVHSIDGMAFGSVELEPEVRVWLEGLPTAQFATAAFYVDLLAEQGALLGEPYTRQLESKLRELRFHAAVPRRAPSLGTERVAGVGHGQATKHAETATAHPTRFPKLTVRVRFPSPAPPQRRLLGEDRNQRCPEINAPAGGGRRPVCHRPGQRSRARH